MKVNKWITGIYLHQYETDLPDGTHVGFDADWGDMYACEGKLVTTKELLEKCKSDPEYFYKHFCTVNGQKTQVRDIDKIIIENYESKQD